MKIDLPEYVLFTQVVFTCITTLSTVYLFVKNPSDLYRSILKIGSYTMLALYSTYLYIFHSYKKLFSDKTALLFWTGTILFCYGYLIYALQAHGQLLAKTKRYIFNHTFANILFVAGSLCFVLDSVFLDKNYTTDNHVFSFMDSMCYLVTCILFLVHDYIKKTIVMKTAMVIFVLGRLISLYIAYNGYEKYSVKHHTDKKNDKDKKEKE
tara:strand:- start:16429 stop:17055 length:627 start_codon:yes stop_codon:yes gene_type:complete